MFFRVCSTVFSVWAPCESLETSVEFVAPPLRARVSREAFSAIVVCLSSAAATFKVRLAIIRHRPRPKDNTTQMKLFILLLADITSQSFPGVPEWQNQAI